LCLKEETELVLGEGVICGASDCSIIGTKREMLAVDFRTGNVIEYYCSSDCLLQSFFDTDASLVLEVLKKNLR